MTQRLRIAIVDDSETVRRSLTSYLKTSGPYEIVAEIADGYTAIQTVARLAPDLIVMDLRMHGIDGITTTHKIKALSPKIKVLVLSGHDSDEEVLAAFAAGADGYILKTSMHQLSNAIQAVFQGIGWIDPALAQAVFSYARQASVENTDALAQYSEQDLLSLRELSVLSELAQGRTSEEIAERLSTTTETVNNHTQSILRKLEVADSIQSALKAIRADGVSTG